MSQNVSGPERQKQPEGMNRILGRGMGRSIASSGDEERGGSPSLARNGQGKQLWRALRNIYDRPPFRRAKESDRNSGQQLLVGEKAFSKAAESFRSIRSSLVTSTIPGGVHSFVMVSAQAGEGSSYCAANLALAFSQLRSSTLLVDANLRDANIGRLFGYDRQQPGLSDLLQGGGTNAAEFLLQPQPSLNLITAGSLTPNPLEFLSSEAFAHLVEHFDHDFDVVIYDTAAAMEHSDAYVVARHVGAGILIVRKNVSKFADVDDIAKQLRTMQCPIVGSILSAE